MGWKIPDIIHQFGIQGGLKVRGLVAFGMYRGFLVSLSNHGAGGPFHLYVAFPNKEDTVRIDPQIDIKPLLKIVDSMGGKQVEPGLISITFNPKWRMPEPTKVKALVDAVIDTVSRTTQPYASSCIDCGDKNPDTLLINGVPSYLCSACLGKMKQEVLASKKAFDAQKPDLRTGLIYALVAVIASAVIWGLIAYIFQVFFFFAGFLIGLFVGYVLTYGTKRINGEVIGLAVLLTVVSVLLGEILYIAFILMGEGVSLVYLLDEFGVYVSEFTGEFLLALFTAIIGAGYVAFRLMGESKAQVPAFEVIS